GAEKFFEMLKYLLMALSVPVYFLLGMPFVESAFNNFKSGFKTNADSLIAIGVTAALLLSIFNTVFVNGPVYYETAVAILVIVTGGRYLESNARAKATRSLGELESTLPREASLVDSSGNTTLVAVSLLKRGDVITVAPGSVIPVDCKIQKGSANVSEAVLTGEPRPIHKVQGDELLAGSTNFDGLLTLEVLKPESESFIANLEKLLGNAKLGKAKIQVSADKASAIAVPIILLIAVGSLAYWWVAKDIATGLFAFLSVVLVACPCALGIATPAALWVAVSESAKRGILFRSLETLERLASVKTIFFDKTGTRTRGEPVVKDIIVNFEKNNSPKDEELFTLIQAVASHSHHPLSRSLANTLPKNGYSSRDISEFTEYPSQGVRAVIDGYEVKLGKRSFVQGDLPARENDHERTMVWCSVSSLVSKEDELIEFIFDDEMLASAKSVFSRLHHEKYTTMILSGDRNIVASRLGAELHSEAKGELSAKEKLAIVRSTWNSVFVGDGMNDAAAIAAAQVGIAFSNGSDITRTEADVVLFDRDLEHIPNVLALSKKTMKIVRQNLWWAFGYNAVGVGFAAIGMLNPIIAALAMVLSSMFVIQNSLRLREETP
ncbi:MAG TPA: cation-translocating P-type ATPase, partial [Candidatus Kapabacteria bacterium]